MDMAQFIARRSPFTLGAAAAIVTAAGMILGNLARHKARTHTFCNEFWTDLNCAVASYRASVAAALHNSVGSTTAHDIIHNRLPFTTMGPHIDLRVNTSIVVDANLDHLRLTVGGPAEVLRSLHRYLVRREAVRIISAPGPYLSPFAAAAAELVFSVKVVGLPSQTVDKLATKVAGTAP